MAKSSVSHKGIIISKDTSGTDRIRTQSLSQTSKGKMDKQIPTNNKITSDKPNQQLFPKQVATQPYLLNQTNRTHRGVKIKVFKNRTASNTKQNETATKVPPFHLYNVYRTEVLQNQIVISIGLSISRYF